MSLTSRYLQVLAAMRAVRAANRETSTKNIATQLNEPTPRVSVCLSKMADAGLLKKGGLVLNFDGKAHSKNMLWRVNVVNVRKLEKEYAADVKNQEADRPTGAVHDVSRSKATRRVPKDSVQDTGELV
jgi:Mn-dependent DtxR family transcriptional regulator